MKVCSFQYNSISTYCSRDLVSVVKPKWLLCSIKVLLSSCEVARVHYEEVKQMASDIHSPPNRFIFHFKPGHQSWVPPNGQRNTTVRRWRGDRGREGGREDGREEGETEVMRGGRRKREKETHNIVVIYVKYCVLWFVCVVTVYVQVQSCLKTLCKMGLSLYISCWLKSSINCCGGYECTWTGR